MRNGASAALSRLHGISFEYAMALYQQQIGQVLIPDADDEEDARETNRLARQMAEAARHALAIYERHKQAAIQEMRDTSCPGDCVWWIAEALESGEYEVLAI